MSSAVQKSNVQAQPLIAVRSVRASSGWYAELLGADSLPEHPHRDLYDRILCSGQLLLQLHAWEKTITPTWSTRMLRGLDTASYFGFSWTTLIPRWSGRAHCELRSS
jgi:hypothetical protein